MAILESHRCAQVTEGLVTATGPQRKEALQEWGDWLSREWSWDLFVTLTHDQSEQALGRGTRTVVGWKASADRWDRFMDLAVVPKVKAKEGLVSPYWVRGREPNPWRKGTHFHALIGGVGEINRRELWEWWFRDQGYGLARILPYEPSKGAAHYLTKYVVKELGDVAFSSDLGLHRRVNK